MSPVPCKLSLEKRRETLRLRLLLPSTVPHTSSEVEPGRTWHLSPTHNDSPPILGIYSSRHWHRTQAILEKCEWQESQKGIAVSFSSLEQQISRTSMFYCRCTLLRYCIARRLSTQTGRGLVLLLLSGAPGRPFHTEPPV